MTCEVHYQQKIDGAEGQKGYSSWQELERELRTGVRLEESRREVGREWKAGTICPRDFKGLVEKS